MFKLINLISICAVLSVNLLDCINIKVLMFIYVEVLWPSQPTGIMLSVVNLPLLLGGPLSC